MKITEPELLDIIAKEALIDRALLVPQATLDDLGVSSMDVMSTLFELEERCGVTFEASDIPPVKTLGELTDYLIQHINSQGAAA